MTDVLARGPAARLPLPRRTTGAVYSPYRPPCPLSAQDPPPHRPDPATGERTPVFDALLAEWQQRTAHHPRHRMM